MLASSSSFLICLLLNMVIKWKGKTVVWLPAFEEVRQCPCLTDSRQSCRLSLSRGPHFLKTLKTVFGLFSWHRRCEYDAGI